MEGRIEETTRKVESSMESREDAMQNVEEDDESSSVSSSDSSSSEMPPTLTTERLEEFTRSNLSSNALLDLKYGDDAASSETNSLTGSDVSKSTATGSSITVSDMESQGDETEPYVAPRGSQELIQIYFKAWTASTIVLFLINCLNMNWKYLFQNEPWWMIILSIVFFCVQGILQWSVLELPLMSFASIYIKAEKDKVGDGRHLTILINYNLLASYRSEVDQTMLNAFEAYTGNLSPSVASALVSATGDEELKAYELEVRDNMRDQIRELVLTEGMAWAKGNESDYDPERAARVFESFRDRETGAVVNGFIETILPALSEKYANDFMVVQRVTRVLRKCGQYQDLLLLSETGENSAWTYTDEKLYKEMARPYGEPLFHPSADVDNIQGKGFDYTLVLDGDTGVVKNSISLLMGVAAANPDRAIIQPSIEMIAEDDQSIFMHIDKMRQEINAPITAALTTLMGRSGFYGKGLIQNRLYIRGVLGTRQLPIERVPIDVLSHDTFEAAALSPLYCTSVSLLEEPAGNYVTWDIRECRWNRGELVLSHYFFPTTLGRFFTWAMTVVRNKPPTELTLRSETHLDAAGSYIAHSALRQMVLKPMLALYIICRVWVKVHFFYNWLPFILMIIVVLILPKIPLTTRDNWHKVLAEMICSILQFSPEPIVGTYRVYKSTRAHITGQSGWVPQFKVEQDFAIKPAVVATFAYQWFIFLTMCACLAPIYIFRPEDYLLQFLFIVTAFLPIYTTLTALPLCSWRSFLQRTKYFLTCCKCWTRSNILRRLRQMRRRTNGSAGTVRMSNNRSSLLPRYNLGFSNTRRSRVRNV